MRTLYKNRWLVTMLCLVFALAACTSAETNDNHDESTAGSETEHDEEADHEHPEGRIPNNGAVIRLVSPADDAVFKMTDEIVIQVEVENFQLGIDGHWHIFVDGSEWSMIMSEATNDTLRGLSPGEHEIEVTLSNNDHQDFEEGDHIHITIEE